MNGHTTSFTVGTKSAGTTGDPDTNAGDRGNVLTVQDAGYSVSGSPSYQKQYSYQYNGYGQKVSETNLNGVQTTYAYGGATDATALVGGAATPLGDLTQVIQDPGTTGHLARTTTLTYDVAGHVTQSTDPSGLTSSFQFNNLGQPTLASFPANGAIPGESISYGYDTNGRALSVTDNRGATTFSYEPGSDRVATVTDPVTGSMGYTYGLAGERLSMSLPGGGTWNYAYADPLAPSNVDYGLFLLPKDDPNSLAPMLESITDDQGRRIDFDLNNAGMPVWTRTNETYSGTTLVGYQEADYNYDVCYVGQHVLDSHYWLKQLTTGYHALANGAWTVTTLAQNVYTLDNTGQRLTNAVTVSGQTARTESYGYDALSRLTSVNYGDGQTQGYGFDAMGNRLTKTDSTTGNESYVYNNANMLLSRTVGGSTTAYNNDPDGNTLAGTGGRVSTWDAQNRMVGCTYNGTTSAYVYGADGIRRRSTVGAVTTDFVTANSMMVREMRSGASSATYLMGGQGPAYLRDDGAGTIRWYVYDGLGSVAAEVDATGAVTASRKYDVYGSVRSSTGVSTSKHKFVGQLGHTSDDESGLIYMRARYVDPAVGRFVSEDMACNGHNWYVYAGDAPQTRVDATGKVDGGSIQALINLGGS